MKSLSILSVMKQLRTADPDGESPAAKSTSRSVSDAEADEDAVNENFILHETHEVDLCGTSSTKMENLLQEFTKLYTDKLQRVEDLALEDEKEYLLRKVGVLESWVEDLGEQNSALVSTVEDLEREASQRVELLQQKLDKMASVTRESCVSLREQQLEMNAIMGQKVLDAEAEAQMLKEKIINLEGCNGRLLQENASLHSDLERFTEELARSTRSIFNTDTSGFSNLTEDEKFLSEFSSPSRSSGIALEDPSCFIRGSYSHEAAKALHIELESLRAFAERSSRELHQKDREISQLRSQLTDLEEKLGKTQMQLEDANEALDHLQRGDLCVKAKLHEFSFRTELNKGISSSTSGRPRPSWKDSQTSSVEVEGTSKIDVEARLSNNIDILAARLNDLEEECEELRDQYTTLKATHDLCDPTISRLQEQLNYSHMSMDELRSVLTSEVAERHDVVISLRKQIDELKRQNHDANLQLQIKSDIIDDFQKQKQKDKLQRVKMEDAMTNTLPAVEATNMVKKNRSETRDSWTNTQAEEMSPNALLDAALHISKFENEIAEKNILIRELQTHLQSSRKEVNLKDETLNKVEEKLNTTRRKHDEKEDRLHYLNGQLTVLQLEVSRLHGQSQQLKYQLENKSALIQKLEEENTSLSCQLNDKSVLMETQDKTTLRKDSQIENFETEVAQQKMTIASLQEALVVTKQTCDKLRSQMNPEVSPRLNPTAAWSFSNWHPFKPRIEQYTCDILPPTNFPNESNDPPSLLSSYIGAANPFSYSYTNTEACKFASLPNNCSHIYSSAKECSQHALSNNDCTLCSSPRKSPSRSRARIQGSKGFGNNCSKPENALCNGSLPSLVPKDPPQDTVNSSLSLECPDVLSSHFMEEHHQLPVTNNNHKIQCEQPSPSKVGPYKKANYFGKIMNV